MELTWRKCDLDDVRLLADMNAALIEDESDESAPDLHVLRIRLHGWLSRREYHAALFCAAGQPVDPVAYALWQDRGNEVFLRHFFVARDWRRQGVGRGVINLLEHHVLPRGRRIILEVLSGNQRGRAFWHALGYLPYSVTLCKDPDESPERT